MVMATRGVIPGTYYALSFINGGGLNLRWFRDTFGLQEKKEAEAAGEEVYKIFDNMAAQVSPGSGGALFIPHLQGRVLPPDHPVGPLGRLHLRTSAATVRLSWRGAYEYPYLEIEKKLHPGLECREVGHRRRSLSKLWNQIKTRRANIPYCRVGRSEKTRAAHGCRRSGGKFKDLRETAKKYTRITSRIEPRQEYHRFYRPYVEMYSEILERYKEVFGKLSGLPLELKNETSV